MRVGVAFLLTVALALGAMSWGPRAARADGGEARLHWAEEDVKFVRESKIWVPPPGTEADYDRSVSPEEWNAMVCRLFGAVPGDDRTPGSLRFWLWSYTGASSDRAGIARAYALGAFMKILNMYGLVGLSSLGPPRHGQMFTDGADVPDLQGALVDVAVDLGLIRGFPDGTLRPQQPLTLGEAATFLRRAVDKFGLLGRVLVPTGVQVNAVRKSAGEVELTLYADKFLYRRGETVGLVAGVENKSAQEVKFTRGNIGDPLICVAAEPADPASPVKRVILEEEDLSPVRLPAVTGGTLAAGASVAQRIAWRPVFPAAEEPLPAGKYRITATFLRQLEGKLGDGTAAEPLSVSIDIEIAGEDTVLVDAGQVANEGKAPARRPREGVWHVGEGRFLL